MVVNLILTKALEEPGLLSHLGLVTVKHEVRQSPKIMYKVIKCFPKVCYL